MTEEEKKSAGHRGNNQSKEQKTIVVKGKAAVFVEGSTISGEHLGREQLVHQTPVSVVAVSFKVVGCSV